ncbi:hypothetical protein P174DRAFT_380734, partial [Aspergillus novofumigatus IBT 16806]
RPGVKTIPSRGFSRVVGGAPDPAKVRGSASHRTLAPDKPISGWKAVKKKRELFPGPRRRLRVQLRCRGESTSRCRNVNRLPFRHTAHEGAFQTELPYALGSTNPCPTAVHMEPFPTSVLKVLI